MKKILSLTDINGDEACVNFKRFESIVKYSYTDKNEKNVVLTKINFNRGSLTVRESVSEIKDKLKRLEIVEL